jgi:hypothetical protein
VTEPVAGSAAEGGRPDLEAGPRPVPLAASYADLVLPVTGDPRVDDGLARLGELADLPVEEHLAVYSDVHHRLHDTLAELDAGGPSPA